MPPRPARRGRGVSRYPVRSSVHNITNLAQWNRLHRRGKNQLIFVMYTLEYVRNSHRLKTTLVELSAHNEFSDVIFAIVDIEKAKEVAEQEGITDAPTFVCYQSNSVIDKLEMLHRNAVRVRAETHRNFPNATRSNHWRAIGQVLSFFAFSIGAVLAVVLMKPMSPQEEEPKKAKATRGRSRSRSRSRSRYDETESSDED